MWIQGPFTPHFLLYYFDHSTVFFESGSPPLFLAPSVGGGGVISLSTNTVLVPLCNCHVFLIYIFSLCGGMAFIPGDDFDAEIRATFDGSSVGVEPPVQDDLKPLFKEHKKLIIKSLNRKWDILSLESYIERGIVPRGLRERVVPATHLHTEKFLTKWKEQCIKHGLEVMRLIVEEEKDQLTSLQIQIQETSEKLEPLKDNPDFERLNDFLKKEVDRTQKNLKITKHNKFKRDLDDWAKGEIFDLSVRGSRSRSRNRRFPSCSDTETGAQSSGSEDETRHTVSFLDKDLLDQQKSPPSRGILKGGKQGTTGGGGNRGKGRQGRKEGRGDPIGTERTTTRSQKRPS